MAVKPSIQVSFASLTHTGQYTDNYPFGISMVAAYIKGYFNDLVDINIYKHPEKFAADLNENIPTIVCFSSYVWNARLSYEFAKRIKCQSPNTVIIFGGPNFPLVPYEQERYLKEFPCIDFFVFREGEHALALLLEHLFKVDLDVGKIKNSSIDLPNTYYMNGGSIVIGAPLPPIANLDELPSPYLTGICDKLLEDEKITPLIQIARGCPFKCSFCQEGESFFNKVRRFSVERLTKELRYIAKRTHSPVLQLADSNFGMYKEDITMCKEIAKIQEEFNWPKYVADFSGKNQKERVLNAVETIHGSHFLSAAIQSTDPEVLKAVNRENVHWDQMIYVAQRGKEIDANSFAEIILALPADTKEAHFKSMSDLIDADMNVVRSHQFIMLLGSSGCSDQSRDRYKMQTRFRVMPNTVVPYTLFGDTFYIPEIDEICVGNSTMSFDDYIDCRLFDLTVELFYNNGIFDELYKYLGRLDISISLLIRNIHKAFLNSTGPLRIIKKDFIRETKELWETPEELELLLKDPKMIEQYEAGIVGNNEQIMYRTRAVFQHLDALHEISFSEASKMVKLADLSDRDTERYMMELKEVSLMRKFNVLSYKTPSTRKFHYDFIEMEAQKFKVDPYDYFKPKGIDIEVGHSIEQKELIDQYTEQYGMSETSLGYILSSAANFNKFYRELN